MSLQPRPVDPVPDDTARVARAAFPRASAAMRLRDALGAVYRDEHFAALFAARGRPAVAPWRLAVVTVLQFMEGLSDRQAADAVRARIDWKYALGLELADPGFHYSVLSEFRARFVADEAETLLLDRLLDALRAAGLLAARGPQRTDSTHVLGAIRQLNRLELVGETLRHALNSLAVAAPDWLGARLEPDWPDRYGRRVEDVRLPESAAARRALAEAIGRDGLRLLEAIVAPAAPPWLGQLPAVEALRRVWLQQYYAPDAKGRVRWREPADQPPNAALLISPYDPQARFSTKRTAAWAGFKVHLTESCDDDRPRLITQVTTTPATTADAAETLAIQGALAQAELLPAVHLVDGGYMGVAQLLASRAEHGVDLLGPVPPDASWQAQAGEGFDSTGFALDWAGQTATCPQGRTSRWWRPATDLHGHAVVRIIFDRDECQACPSRAKCTRATTAGRVLCLRPQAEQAALRAARERQAGDEFKARYAQRAGVEGTISQGVRAFGLRRSRYRGLAKTRLQHAATAAAINVARTLAWLEGVPLATTRQSPLVRLATARAATGSAARAS
jgi:transposase